jgi:hypothetical protein
MTRRAVDLLAPDQWLVSGANWKGIQVSTAAWFARINRWEKGHELLTPQPRYLFPAVRDECIL